MDTDEQDWAAIPAPRELPGAGSPAEQFARLTAALLDATSVSDVLERVVWTARRVVPGADLVSITLRSPDGTFHTPVDTDPAATELDLLQYETGEGPCLDAARDPRPAEVRCHDLATARDWPRFGQAAVEHRVHAVLSVPLLSHARRPRHAGALNIYSRCPEALSPDAHEPALLLATHASLALAATAAVACADVTTAQLTQAIESRDVIGQAKGILMSRRGIGPDEAFEQLRRASQSLNVKLADVAHLLATRHTELDLR